MADVGVVGGGIVGLATAYAVAQRGASVRLYERGVPGNGQSGGESRLFRHGHDDPRLVAFALESRSLWRAWGERLGVELVSGDGVVGLGPRAVARLGVLERIGGVPARAIGPDELSARLPLLAGCSAPAVLDEAGGAIRTRTAIAALSGALGASLVADEVLALRPRPHGTVEVRTGGGSAEHSSVVVCAGTGTAPLAREAEVSLPVALSAHVRATFAVRGEPSDRLACLQDSSDEFGEVRTYAAPEPGNRRYGVGISETTGVRSDRSVVDPGALASLAGRASAYVRRALPGLDPEPVEYRHCWVTHLPWGPDGAAVWECGRVFLVAGHNLFKLAPALGTALAAAATGEDLRPELRPEAMLGAAA